ncbi:fumarylacetoacetate hydrolase family protein [Telmatospirillum sp.]|uniref:fumarylacetoacetate hydrolase family protein n=1 Tax=Telmatospirillum sp. TaxID=2079197 RepID=UPI00284387EC|nr:fumarylacetoacetate hydrolase family protein [Telmatospirillum sp.]MDR3439049.1 fumarylacetoacetate hydrolase family protein [Telmatospirillum sp.]
MQTSGNGSPTLPTNVILLSILNDDGSETLGVKTADGILDVRQAARLLEQTVPSTLDRLLQDGGADALATLIADASASPKTKSAFHSEGSIRFGRLFTNPGKVICVGLNYRHHAQEVGAPIPKQPVLFSKFNNALAAHRCVITLPSAEISHKFDYETELLMVIGKAARNVSETDAPNYIAGYCTAHDFSARDLQTETGGQWLIGKTLDNFAPIGPYFVSADLVGDPHKLAIKTTVNGEVRQSWNTDDFIFNCYQIVAYISKHWTLEPGDIIFTGTPQGVIAGKPADQQVWLKAGDVIESSVEKLGTLSFSLA